MVWQEIAAKQLLVESVRMVLEASGSENFSLLFPDLEIAWQCVDIRLGGRSMCAALSELLHSSRCVPAV